MRLWFWNPAPKPQLLITLKIAGKTMIQISADELRLSAEMNGGSIAHVLQAAKEGDRIEFAAHALQR